MKKPSTKTVRRMGKQQDQQLTIGLGCSVNQVT